MVRYTRVGSDAEGIQNARIDGQPAVSAWRANATALGPRGSCTGRTIVNGRDHPIHGFGQDGLIVTAVSPSTCRPGISVSPSGISSGIISGMPIKSKTDAAAQALKVRENRLRRVASRQHLELVKARQRDSRGAIYGTYGLTDGRAWVYLSNREEGYGLSLDEVEAFLNTPPSRRSTHA